MFRQSVRIDSFLRLYYQFIIYYRTHSSGIRRKYREAPQYSATSSANEDDDYRYWGGGLDFISKTSVKYFPSICHTTCIQKVFSSLTLFNLHTKNNDVLVPSLLTDFSQKLTSLLLIKVF